MSRARPTFVGAFHHCSNRGHGKERILAGDRDKEVFGSTLCREITQCDFSASGDVQRYIAKGSVNTCKAIAEKTARQAERIIKQNGVGF